MNTYANKNGDSSIVEYEHTNTSITIKFLHVANWGYKHSNTYKYTSRSAGQTYIDFMIELAENGQGLNSFIDRNKIDYESRWMS